MKTLLAIAITSLLAIAPLAAQGKGGKCNSDNCFKMEYDTPTGIVAQGKGKCSSDNGCLKPELPADVVDNGKKCEGTCN